MIVIYVYDFTLNLSETKYLNVKSILMFYKIKIWFDLQH